MNITEQIIELNRQAQEIATAHPDDYHHREDFRAIVDRRNEIQREIGKCSKSHG